MKKLLLLFLIVTAPGLCFARVIGKSGQVYSIDEISIAALIEAKVQSMDPAELEKKIKQDFEKKVLSYRPRNGVQKLGKVQTQNLFSVDMNHTLDRDIVSATGAIIYPKGYTFNVLSLLADKGIHYPLKLVIIDGSDEKEVSWYINNLSKDMSYRLLITDGYASDIINRFNVPTYYATKEIVDKFSVTKTPSIVFQPYRKTFMAVLETPVTTSIDESINSTSAATSIESQSKTKNSIEVVDPLKDIKMPEDFYEQKKEFDKQTPSVNTVIDKNALIN